MVGDLQPRPGGKSIVIFVANLRAPVHCKAVNCITFHCIAVQGVTVQGVAVPGVVGPEASSIGESTVTAGVSVSPTLGRSMA